MRYNVQRRNRSLDHEINYFWTGRGFACVTVQTRSQLDDIGANFGCLLTEPLFTW